jgi:restriction endonuclease S subunit
MKLHQLAYLLSGFQFRGRVEPDPRGDVAVIQVKDIVAGQPLRLEELTRVKIEKEIENYSVTKGDILFLSRGQRLNATLIDQPLHRTIAPGYFFIVRPDPSAIVPAYLAWFINQEPAQNQLKPSHAGTHMPMVPMSAFRELRIDVPPLSTQQTIVRLSELAEQEHRLVAELQDVRDTLLQHICLRAARSAGERE